MVIVNSIRSPVTIFPTMFHTTSTEIKKKTASVSNWDMEEDNALNNFVQTLYTLRHGLPLM